MPETEVKEEMTKAADTATETIQNKTAKKPRKSRTNPDGTAAKRSSRRRKSTQPDAAGKNNPSASHRRKRSSAKPSKKNVDEQGKESVTVSASAASFGNGLTMPVVKTAAVQDAANPADLTETASADAPKAQEASAVATETTMVQDEVREEKAETQEPVEAASEVEETHSAVSNPSTEEKINQEASEASVEQATITDEPLAAKEPHKDAMASSLETNTSAEAVEPSVKPAPVTDESVSAQEPNESSVETTSSVDAAETPVEQGAMQQEQRKADTQISFQQTVRFASVEEGDFEPKIVRELGSDPAKTSWVKGLYDPISNMLAQASTDAHSDWKYAFWRIVLKYGICAFFFVFVLQGKLNSQSFSFARMPFTDGVSLWVRIVIFGTITEYAAALLKTFLGGFRFNLSSFLRLVDISCESAWFLTLLYSLAALFLNAGLYLSFILVCAAFVSSGFLHTIAYEYTFQCGRRRSLLACVCTAVLTAVLIGLWIKWFGGDLIRIVNSFITL